MIYEKHTIAAIFIFAVFNIFSVTGQTIPEWFLYPQKGEYTGVSYPSKDSYAQHSSALMSALLHYKASVTRNETVANITAETAVVEYKIVREYINENGELFVAINILPSKTDSLRVVFKEESAFSKWGEENKMEHTIKQAVRVKCVYKQEIFYEMLYQQVDNDITGKIKLLTLPDSYNEFAFSNFCKYTYDVKMLSSLENCGWRYSCDYSLHTAYMQILLAHIHKGIKLTTPISLIDNTLISHRND